MPTTEPSELTLFTRKVLIVAAVVVGLALLWSVREIVVLIFMAGVIATGIAPAVRKVQILGRHYTGRKMRRGVAVLVVYLPVLLALVLFVLLVIPRLLSQSKQLAAVLPGAVQEKILQPMEHYLPVAQVQHLLMKGKPEHLPILPVVRGAITLVSSVVVVLVMVAYMLLDAERLQSLFLLFYAAGQRRRKQRLVRRVSRRMSAWLGGQLLLSGIIGASMFVGLLLLRIPYALPLALLMAIGELVPVIGPLVGVAPSLVLAILQSSWQFWSVIVMAIVLQQIENHLLAPRLMGSMVSISPLSVIIAFMCGATLFGIPGAMMAVPLAAILQVVFEESFVLKRERRQDTGRPGTLVTEASVFEAKTLNAKR